MQSSMWLLRGGVLTLFSLFFFLHYELSLSETIFTGLTLQVIYCSESVARCTMAYVRILDKEKCCFLRWLMSGSKTSEFKISLTGLLFYLNQTESEGEKKPQTVMHLKWKRIRKMTLKHVK